MGLGILELVGFGTLVKGGVSAMLTYGNGAADPSRPVTSRTEANGCCEILPVNEGQGLPQFTEGLMGGLRRSGFDVQTSRHRHIDLCWQRLGSFKELVNPSPKFLVIFPALQSPMSGLAWWKKGTSR